MPLKLDFDTACCQYVHRFTMEHIPQWADVPCEGSGLYYAPHYRTDREWYDNTEFKPANAINRQAPTAHSSNQSWPLGEWLGEPARVVIARHNAALARVASTRSPSRPFLKHILQDAYLDYLNNYLTRDRFGKAYGLKEEQAGKLIDLGRSVHENIVTE